MPRLQPTDLHRAYLQVLLSRRHIPDDVALELYKRTIAAVRKNDDEFAPTNAANWAGLRTFIQECSTLLDAQDLRMEVKSIADEERYGRDVYVLINTDGTESSLGMSDFEPLHLSYFNVVIEAILTAFPDYSVGSKRALSLTSSVEGTITKMTAQSLLNAFVARGWLVQSKRGRYTLGARAMAELSTSMVEQFPDYLFPCARCSKHVISGKACANPDCQALIHGSCYTSLSKAARPKCPSCSREFAEFPPKPLGEEAVSRAEDDYAGGAGRGRGGKGKGKGKRKRPSGLPRRGRASGGEVEGEGDEDDEEGDGEGDDDEDELDDLNDLDEEGEGEGEA